MVTTGYRTIEEEEVDIFQAKGEDRRKITPHLPKERLMQARCRDDPPRCEPKGWVS